jgi:hypothetical protein
MSDSTLPHPDGFSGANGGGEDGNVTELHRPVDFTIDGRPEQTTVRRQPAADLLRLVGLDPAFYDLGQLHGHNKQPTRFRDDQIVDIHQGDRFVSIRCHADVA